MPDFLCPHALFVSDVCSEVISYERAGNIYTHIYIRARAPGEFVVWGEIVFATVLH